MSLLFYVFAVMALAAAICQLFIGEWLLAAGYVLAILVNVWMANKAESEEMHFVGD